MSVKFRTSVKSRLSLNSPMFVVSQVLLSRMLLLSQMLPNSKYALSTHENQSTCLSSKAGNSKDLSHGCL